MMAAIAGLDSTELTGTGLCTASAELLSVDGAAIALLTSDGVPVATYRSNASFQPIEDLQFVLGVGPTLDAYRQRSIVVESDFEGSAPLRWPGLAKLALDSGVRSVSALPLQIGAARLGAITLFDSQPGALEGERLADAYMLAGIVTRTLVAIQAGKACDGLVEELSDNVLLIGEIDHAEVHQASGMVSIQLGTDVGDALARIRASAFADGTTVHQVAVEVLARRLRFSP